MLQLVPAGAAPAQALKPPAWATEFRSDNLDEVRALIGSTDGRQSRVARPGEAFAYSQFRLKGDRTNLGGSDSASGQTVRGLVHGAALVLAMPVGSIYRAGRRASAASGPSSMAIVPPGMESTRVSPPGSMFAIEVQALALAEELAARRPGLGLSRQLAVLNPADATRADLLQASHALMQATRPGADAGQLALAEGRVVGLLAALVLPGAADERPGALAQARVADLEGWIEAHLNESITLGRLCQIAGVGERCLQKAFEARHGLSPMRFVIERRVSAAHQALLSAGPGSGVSVTRIALAHGFDHLSRFAQTYRQIIGESPSQTLAMRRWAA
jgi:AraC-like DNA-binding protein